MERVDNFKWNGRSTSTGIRIKQTFDDEAALQMASLAIDMK